MTPKEKALELIDNYEDKCPEYIRHNTAKWCALIAVDEILNELQIDYNEDRINYYLETRLEIEKL
jgi:hypothetical protein